MITRFVGQYAFLNPTWITRVFYQGEIWTSAEAAFQATKTDDSEIKKKIFYAQTVQQVKKIGETITVTDEWINKQINIMKEITYAKFSQNKVLCNLLLQTEKEKIVYHDSENNTFWGVYNNFGYNHLGLILEQVRDQLQKEKQYDNS